MIYGFLLLLTLINVVASQIWIRRIGMFTIAVLLTTTYYNGSDWRTYELAYYGAGEVFASSRSWSSTFLWISESAHNLGLSFHAYLIILKITVFLSIVVLCKKAYPQFKLLLPLFLILTGVNLFIDNTLRQFLALPFFLWAVAHAEGEKYTEAFLLILAGSLFHFSILIAGVTLIFVFAPGFSSKYRAFAITMLFGILAIAFYRSFFQYFSTLDSALGFYFRHYVLTA